MNIKEALSQLDPQDDADWTAEGLPLVGAVTGLTGRPVTRQEIIDAWPSFTRDLALASAGDDPEGGEDVDLDLDDGANEADPDMPTDAAGDADGDSRTPFVPSPSSVLRMPPQTVLNSKELTRKAWKELNDRILAVAERKRVAEAELAQLNAHCDLLTRHMERMEKEDPTILTANIRQYLDRSLEVNAARADATHRFIEAGTSARQVSNALRTKSPVDEAMGRKPTRGAQRPTLRPSTANI